MEYVKIRTAFALSFYVSQNYNMLVARSWIAARSKLSNGNRKYMHSTQLVNGQELGSCFHGCLYVRFGVFIASISHPQRKSGFRPYVSLHELEKFLYERWVVGTNFATALAEQINIVN
jgi:hypothetical protein